MCSFKAFSSDVTVVDLPPEKYDPPQVKQESESGMPSIKQEAEPETPYVKEEEWEDEITFPMTISVKSEEEYGPSEESGAAKPSRDSSFQHPTTKDVTVEDLHSEKHEPLHIKQEENPGTHSIKEEEQEDEVSKFPITISVKTEEHDGPSKESGAAKPSGDSSFQHTATKEATKKDLHPEKHDASHVKQEKESEMPSIKKEVEPETRSIKEEEQEDEITKFPMIVTVKSEVDEGPMEVSRAAKRSRGSSFQHLTTKGEAQLQPDDLFAPLSDSDDVTSHSSGFSTDEKDVDFDQNAPKSLNKSSLKRDTKECADVTVDVIHSEKGDSPHIHQEEESETPYIKQEAEPETPYIKEEQEDKLSKFPIIVSIKSEKDEVPSKESGAANPLKDSSFQHQTTKEAIKKDLHPEKHDANHVKQEKESEMPSIKKEAEPETRSIKEEQEDEITKFPMIVSVKSEVDEGPMEVSRAAKRSRGSSFQHLTTKDVTVDVLHSEKDDSPHIHQEEESETPYIKQEAEPETPYIKEEQEDKLSKFPIIVSIKSEKDEVPSKESGAANPLKDSSFQHQTTKGEGLSQPDDRSALLSDSDDVTSHSPDYNTDEEDVEFDQNALKSVNKSTLKRRTKECAGRKPFACSVCEKRFTVKAELDRHARAHTREKPFACPFCDKRFRLNHQLTSHLSIHTGEKPFACSLCNKRFRWNNQITRHMSTHTGEKPFASPFCEKKFTKKGNLDVHTLERNLFPA
ncbi:zinc finger protein 37-like isoform X4 [Corythoichthys intestinalis]|uniref:zinc finger protein 37-like isoform X4 n=1 Tax=Corythoichthys intestinalis TaxID=161448 RepID=UPI0025A62B1C|nr:zinc finger protein 37-like isoform X4 [Corythoichthys intestinalis]